MRAYSALAKIEAWPIRWPWPSPGSLRPPRTCTAAGSRHSSSFSEARRPVANRPGDAASPAWSLLARALDDDAPAVRSEAWKAILNLKTGSAEQRLRFARRSAHADVRREVLTEAAAKVDEPWTVAFVYEFFNDPDPGLRTDFAQATLKKQRTATAGVRPAANSWTCVSLI